MLTSLCVLAVALGVACAHLCLLSPPQRGSMIGFDKPGADNCFLTQGRCGGRTSAGVKMAVKKGENMMVHFQKNLDHFDKSTPGMFQILMGKETAGTRLTPLASVPDTDAPSLTIYDVNVTIPTSFVSGEIYIMQVTYLTKNPQAPAEFYQCSDGIMVN